MSPGALDPTLIRRHLAAVQSALRQLRRHAGRPVAALADLDEAWAVERGLQLVAQNVLDIATHLAASAGLDVPDYATAIDRLADIGVLPRRFAREFRAVAGFRNIIVHGYLEVDSERIHTILNERLGDFDVFAARVTAYIDQVTG